MIDQLKARPRLAALAGVALAVLLAGGGYAAWVYWLQPPPPMPETMDEVEALFASDAYSRLSTEDRQPYQERSREIMRESGWEGRQQLMDNDAAREQVTRDMIAMMDSRFDQMAERAKEYALADQAGRLAILQQDAQQGRGGWFGGGRGGGDRGGRGGGEREGQGPTDAQQEQMREQREQMREQFIQYFEDRINEGNGQEQALMREYRDALRQHRGQ